MIIRNIKQSDNKALAGLIKAVFEEYHAPLVNTVYDDPRTLALSSWQFRTYCHYHSHGKRPSRNKRIRQ